MKKKAYTAIILGLLVNGEKVNVGFTTKGFVIPGHGLVNINELVETETEKLKIIEQEEDKIKKAQLNDELVLSKFIGRYVEKKATSGLFDILTDQEAADFSIETTKYDLAVELEKTKAELEEARKALAAVRGEKDAEQVE